MRPGWKAPATATTALLATRTQLAVVLLLLGLNVFASAWLNWPLLVVGALRSGMNGVMLPAMGVLVLCSILAGGMGILVEPAPGSQRATSIGLAALGAGTLIVLAVSEQGAVGVLTSSVLITPMLALSFLSSMRQTPVLDPEVPEEPEVDDRPDLVAKIEKLTRQVASDRVDLRRSRHEAVDLRSQVDALRVLVARQPTVVFKPMKPEREETDVYRLFGANGSLLYVGIGQHASRWRSHRDEKPWWGEVTAHRTARYPYRCQALAVEHSAIRYEKPKYNRSRGGLTDAHWEDGWTQPRHVSALLPTPRVVVRIPDEGDDQ